MGPIVRAAHWLWDCLFAPPRVERLPEGGVRVRLMGRAFEAADYEGLFTAVNRERERLIQAVAKAHEGASRRSDLAFARVGPGEWYQRDLRRMEDRLSLYNEFLAHLLHLMRPEREQPADTVNGSQR